MRPRSLEEVAAAVDGSVRGERKVVVRAAAVDSRQAGPGDLFVALPGEGADGHDFVGEAMARGASAAMVRRGWRGGVEPTVEVADPGAALLRLARDERSSISAQVVAITGSTGKTMTKDLTAAVLGRRFRVVASPSSFNNEVGLPLTLLRADERTEAVVCEMGSRGPGHIRLLCEVATPTVGVVTNAGEAHMERFGSRKVLRDAKAELPEALPASGVAVLNADDPAVRTYADRTRARVVLFGTAPGADVSAEALDVHRGTGQAEFLLRTPDGSAPVLLSVPGEHMVGNALAAAAVGWALGVPVESSAEALAIAPVTGGRMQISEAGGVRIVNDAYNANPTSTAAALRAVRWMAGSGRCIAVLGHMAEHRDAPSRTGHPADSPEGGRRRGRVGVIRVVDDAHPAGLRDLHPPARNRRGRQSLGGALDRHAERPSHGGGGQRVAHHVFTRYRQQHRRRSVRRAQKELGLSGPAVDIERLRGDVGARSGPEQDDPHPGPVGVRTNCRVVGVQHGHPAGGERFRELGLRVAQHLPGAEALHVGLSRV